MHYKCYQIDHYSWKFKLLNLIFKIPFKRIIQNPDKILSRRNFWSRVNKKFKLCPGTKCEPLMIDSIKAEWISPIESDNLPIVLYIHGGGFVAGSIDTHRIYLSYFSSITNARVLVIDYRLAPEHPYPAALDDCYQSYLWLLKQDFKASKIFIAGESAGGGLALALILKLRDTNKVMPVACIAMSPWADLTQSGKTFKDNDKLDIILNPPALPKAAAYYIENHNPQDPYISPMYGAFHNLCPILIHIGTYEILLSDSLTLIDKITRAQGNITYEIWPKLFHAWHYSAGFLDEAKHAVANIKKYMDTQLSKQRLIN